MQAKARPLPQDRQQLLAQLGPHKTAIYRMVRAILDDLEQVAPWDELYYPSQDDQEFIEMEFALLEVIDAIPARVKALIESLRNGGPEAAAQELLGDAEFYFEGIHGSVAPDIAKLRAKLKGLNAAAGVVELTSQERDFTCEISADLKGKYASSIMGAAAGLVAEGDWSGVEIEPILFPEKAEEFERNERLVETLSTVVENITNLLDEVPLAEMVETWGRGERIDLYALTPLYSFLGNLGKLMKEESRRALYSGDYHQVRRRERLLNTRINELTTIHNLTWATESEPRMPDGGSPFPVMIQKATELAGVLDVNILRQIVGEKLVKDLLMVVTVERERAEAKGLAAGGAPASSMRKSIPEHLHPLIPLLYDEDLLNFLGLLLGAVLKRASLSLARQRDAAAHEAEAETAPEESAAPAGGPGSAPETSFGAAAGTAEVSFGDDSDDADRSPKEVDFGDAGAPAEFEGFEIDDEPEIDFMLPSIEEAFKDLEPDIEPPPDPQQPPATLAESEPPPELVEPPAPAAFEPPPGPAEPASFEPAAPAAESAAPVPPAAGPDPDLAEKLESLSELHEILRALRARTNAHRKSFALILRLLKQRRSVPPAMLQSMHPYLYDMMNTLVPKLHDLDHIADISSTQASNLFDYCTFLCDRNLMPSQLIDEVPRTMQRVMRLLDALAAITPKLIKDLRASLTPPNQ